MDMRHPDGVTVKHVYLPRRSLLVMAGAARYQWTHGIASRKTDMVGIISASASLQTSVRLRNEATYPIFVHRFSRISFRSLIFVG